MEPVIPISPSENQTNATGGPFFVGTYQVPALCAVEAAGAQGDSASANESSVLSANVSDRFCCDNSSNGGNKFCYSLTNLNAFFNEKL